MKILIIGSNGNLGKALVKRLKDDNSLLLPTRKEFDITNETLVNKIILEEEPEIIINTAAITDVDGCERIKGEAFKVNSLGPYFLAQACKKTDSFLIQISTEMIFDGLKETPYLEEDNPNPLSTYGLTKYFGELMIKTVPINYAIFRTSWLFGGSTPKFVNKFIAKAEELSTIKVVTDQIGSPTYVDDLAEALRLFLQKPLTGIFHLANSGSASRMDMARLIKEVLQFKCNLIPVTYEKLGIETYRPPRAVLASQYKDIHSFVKLRPWQEALTEYLINKI